MSDENNTSDENNDIVPRARPGYRTPEPSWSRKMGEWAPVTASLLRAFTGLIAFVGTLLFMPLHHATPLLVGVSLVMVVGGCTSTLKTTRDEPGMRTIGRRIVLATAALVMVGLVVAVIKGPGAYAPDIHLSAPAPAPAPPADDGTIRFSPG